MTNKANGHDRSNGEDSMGEQQEVQPELNMLTQYVKDLSFENPNAPESLKALKSAPEIQIGINVEARKLDDETFEVTLEFTADAKTEGKFIYKMEIQYAGVFSLKNMPDEILQPVLFIECPSLIFPFLRHTIVRLSTDGGFPPLQLDPIDFARMFQENVEKLQKQPAEQTN